MSLKQFSYKIPVTYDVIEDMEAVKPKLMDEIYTTTQAANFFSVSKRTIQDWITRGYFPNAYKLNPHAKRPEYRIPRSDIAKIIELRRLQQTTVTAGNSANPG